MLVCFIFCYNMLVPIKSNLRNISWAVGTRS